MKLVEDDKEQKRKLYIRKGYVVDGEEDKHIPRDVAFPPEPPKGLVPPDWWELLIDWALRVEGKIDAISESLMTPGSDELYKSSLHYDMGRLVASSKKAAFIWAHGNDDDFGLQILMGHVQAMEELGYQIKIWGPPSINDTTYYPSKYYQGEPTKQILEDYCFNHSWGFLKGDAEKIFIMIDDHSTWGQGDTEFIFKTGDNSYRVPHSNIFNWMEPHNMVYGDCCMVIRGQNSGKALGNLEKPDRVVMSSMGDTETADPDKFDISQELSAGMSWREAFEEESRLMDDYQHPQISPP